jgi:hypothetical protein
MSNQTPAEAVPGVYIRVGDEGVLPVSVRDETILVNEGAWALGMKWPIPFARIDSISWGSSHLLFINWTDAGQFRQLGFSGRAQSLAAFLARIQRARPELRADEANRGWTGMHSARTALAVILVLGLPLLLYFLAKTNGWLELP